MMENHAQYGKKNKQTSRPSCCSTDNKHTHIYFFCFQLLLFYFIFFSPCVIAHLYPSTTKSSHPQVQRDLQDFSPRVDLP